MNELLQELDKPKKKRWYQRMRARYRLVIRDDETYEEKLSFRLSRLNVFVFAGSIAILLIILTTYIIAFTSLREYIPGYTDVNLSKNVYDLHTRADSLEFVLGANEQYLSNLRLILLGEDPEDINYEKNDSLLRQYTEVQITHSKADSLLREEFENQVRMYSITGTSEIISTGKLSGQLFFSPLKGIVTNEFNPLENHYGIDIVAPENEVVKATLDGIVLISSWTIETGHVIVIQHQQNYISVYKHNAVLFKKEGAYVRAGEPIAIVGESGEYSTGPHLHFELWYNGNALNPRDYMIF
ncbi:MAG: M23 family metallopeptidase [Bacteroidales bacterium]|nr:M23 family metallopeptidase [Bacteroidales bacterium]